MVERIFENTDVGRISAHNGAPKELWLVTDKDGDIPKVCNSAKDAETVRAYRQLEFPALGPHCVTHYREVSDVYHSDGCAERSAEEAERRIRAISEGTP